MVKTIKKTFADFDKETQWLNQMSADGYAPSGLQGWSLYVRGGAA